MRAYDVGIGLAVAWARMRGHDVRVASRPWLPRFETFIWCHGSTYGFEMAKYRGPVLGPVPLTDTHVAFGIATRRIWLRVPTSGPEMCAFATALLMATEARVQSVREAGARARRRSP